MIDTKMLTQIQATGITDADYERVAQYIDTIKVMEPLSFQKVYIVDYFKMNYYYQSPQYQNNDIAARDEILNGFGLGMNDKDEQAGWLLIAKCQEFIQQQPADERKNYVFIYTFHLKQHGSEIFLNYRSRVLETAPDGRVWLELGVLSIAPHKDTGRVVIKNIKDGKIFIYDLSTSQLVLLNDMYLSKMERTVLRMAGQGYNIKDIAERMHRADSTIDTHRKRLFKKLGAHNMIEAIGYAASYNLL